MFYFQQFSASETSAIQDMAEPSAFRTSASENGPNIQSSPPTLPDASIQFSSNKCLNEDCKKALKVLKVSGIINVELKKNLRIVSMKIGQKKVSTSRLVKIMQHSGPTSSDNPFEYALPHTNFTVQEFEFGEQMVNFI